MTDKDIDIHIKVGEPKEKKEKKNKKGDNDNIISELI